MTITFLHEGRYNVQAYASVLRENGGAASHTRIAPIRAWGGPTREILPLTKTVTLAVGESRPVAALAHAQEGPGAPNVRSLSHEPLSFRIEDPTVARVDATGVVQGLKPGSTGLTFRVRDVTARIPVTVTTQALGPPGEGIVPLDGTVGTTQVEYGARLQTPRGPIEDRFTLDEGRVPFAILGVQPYVKWPLLSTTLTALVAAEWTGTGFGLEWVSDGSDLVKSPQVALDERGRHYVVYRSEWLNDLVVAERARGASPGAWTRRRIPMDLPQAREAGLFPGQYLMTNLDDERTALRPREGGGLWLASWKALDFREQKPSEYLNEVWKAPATCAQVLQLTEVTDDAVRVEQVAVDWYDVKGDFTQSSCWRRARAPDETRPFLFLLPPLPGDPRPRLVSLYGDEKNTTLHVPSASGWTRQVLATPTPLGTGGFATHELVVVPPERPGAASVLLTLDTPVSARPPDVWFNALPGQPPTGYAYTGGDPDRQFRFFGFHAQGRLYTGAGFFGPLVRHSPFGGTDGDDPSGSWAPPGSYDAAWGDQFPMRGIAVRGEWLHGVSQSSTGLPLLLTRTLPQPDARPTDPESQGTRLGGVHATPAPLEAPIVLPDGSRYLLTRTHDAGSKGALLRSGGVGQPFLSRAERDITPALALATRVWPVGDSLRTVGEAGSRLRTFVSANQGQGWTLAAELPLEDEALIAQHVTPGGATFGVLRRTARTNFQVAFSPEGAPGPFARLAGFPTDRPSPQVITDATFLPLPSGVLLLVHGPLNDGTAMHDALTVREYDLAGNLVAEKRLELPLARGEYLSTQASVRTATGDILLVSQLSTILVNPSAGTATRSAFSVRMAQDIPPAPVRLTDGRLVLLTTEPERPRVLRAGYRVSSDGLTWGAFHALRPKGGDHQWIVGAAAEADGGLLLALQDSGGMVPGGGPVQFLLQRVAAP